MPELVSGASSTQSMDSNIRKPDFGSKGKKEKKVKVGKNKLKMSSGEVRTFGSQQKRDNFERVAQAYNHGWRPKGGKKGKKVNKLPFMEPF